MKTMQELYDIGLDPDEIGDAVARADHDCHTSPEDGCPICEEGLLNEHISRVGGDE